MQPTQPHTDVVQAIRPYIDATEAEIEATIHASAGHSEAARLYGMLEYHLGWTEADGTPIPPDARTGGKRLRPALCLLFCQLSGGDWRSAAPAAAAIELIHSFSLVHDDVEDGDEVRHHRPAVWAVWGVNHAINCGSNTQALVHAAATRLAERGHPCERTMRVMGLLTTAILRMTEGQFLDMRLEEGGTIPDRRGYYQMVAGKTCALLAAACAIGCVLGNPESLAVPADLPQRAGLLPRPPELQGAAAAAWAFGEALGAAFQARDDFLGAWGDPTVTGKPVGSDLLRRKKSLPVVLAYAAADGEQRRKMERFFTRRTTSKRDVDAMLELIELVGAREACQTEAAQLAEDAFGALEALSNVGDTEDRRQALETIRAVVSYVLERNR